MGFDDPDEPTSMDGLIEALGATPVDYSLKTKCCGASLMGTEEKLALRLCRELLENAVEAGAHCIITLCPLCHMNLDVYQGKVNRLFKTKYKIPILYFSQLIGLALDIPFKQLGLDKLAVKVTGEMKQLIEGARDA
jgi:heterodisulfide reductase subunit B